MMDWKYHAKTMLMGTAAMAAGVALMAACLWLAETFGIASIIVPLAAVVAYQLGMMIRIYRRR